MVNIFSCLLTEIKLGTFLNLISWKRKELEVPVLAHFVGFSSSF